MPALHEYPSRGTCAQALADALAERLREGIAKNGRATLVLSGGSSPIDLFERLALIELDWSRVTVLPSDERWVSSDHADSNEAALRQHLLYGPGNAARLFGLYRDAPTPGEALSDLNTALAELPRPFDAVVLGMGDDGHTASLFPDASNIEACLASDADCVVPDRPNDDGPARISLSLKRLLATRSLYLLFFGDDKRRVYDKACRPGPATEFPVRGVIQQDDVPVDVYWSD
ncbi:6-phosphogluconolactonase [Salinisphaera dokdonensis]